MSDTDFYRNIGVGAIGAVIGGAFLGYWLAEFLYY